MNASTLLGLAAVLGPLLGIAGIIYTYLRADAVKARIEAQDGLISVLQADLSNIKEKLATATTRAEALERENESLRTVVTSRREIERLAAAEQSHHDESIAVLREIREAIRER